MASFLTTNKYYFIGKKVDDFSNSRTVQEFWNTHKKVADHHLQQQCFQNGMPLNEIIKKRQEFSIQISSLSYAVIIGPRLHVQREVLLL